MSPWFNAIQSFPEPFFILFWQKLLSALFATPCTTSDSIPFEDPHTARWWHLRLLWSIQGYKEVSTIQTSWYMWFAAVEKVCRVMTTRIERKKVKLEGAAVKMLKYECKRPTTAWYFLNVYWGAGFFGFYLCNLWRRQHAANFSLTFKRLDQKSKMASLQPATSSENGKVNSKRRRTRYCISSVLLIYNRMMHKRLAWKEC